ISGFTGYVSAVGREAIRTKTALAYGKSLTKNTDVDARAFIMSQLQWIGQGESVDYIKPFLNQAQLVDAASRALVGIGGERAKQSLASALSTATEQTAPSLLEAIAQLKAKEALATVASYASHQNDQIRKAAFSALAAIADPSSAIFLTKEAE